MEKVQFSAEIPEGKTARDLLGKPVKDPGGKVIGEVTAVSGETKTGSVIVTVEVEESEAADKVIAKAAENFNAGRSSRAAKGKENNRKK